ncbi:MAG TPA: Lrp/AsnC family transcriptional regulator [Firmicutes bacterium]|nr:Lrp/AsnC family transcriptional regulator [Bacillota bacterium]
MFLDGLDQLDQQILQLLIRNARMSYSEIGQQVGISRVAVKMRVQALEKKGIIEEYTTIVNPQKISGAVSCYFEIETTPESLMEVARRLKENETVTQIYRVTGKSKLHVHGVASSNEEMERLMYDTIDQLPGVVEYTCNVIVSRIKDIKGLRL